MKNASKVEAKKKVKKHGKKKSKEEGSKRKSAKSKSRKTRDDSSSLEEDSSSEEDELRSKKKSRKEQDDEFESGMNPSEKLLRLRWEKRNEKMSSGPSTPQGSQGFSPYSAQSPPPPTHRGMGQWVGGRGSSGRSRQRRVRGTAPTRRPSRSLPARVTRTGPGGG